MVPILGCVCNEHDVIIYKPNMLLTIGMCARNVGDHLQTTPNMLLAIYMCALNVCDHLQTTPNMLLIIASPWVTADVGQHFLQYTLTLGSCYFKIFTF